MSIQIEPWAELRHLFFRKNTLKRDIEENCPNKRDGLRSKLKPRNLVAWTSAQSSLLWVPFPLFIRHQYFSKSWKCLGKCLFSKAFQKFLLQVLFALSLKQDSEYRAEFRGGPIVNRRDHSKGMNPPCLCHPIISLPQKTSSKGLEHWQNLLYWLTFL